MKKLFVIALAGLTFTVAAQKTPVKKAAPTTGGMLKNLTDSASYGIGLSVINFYKQQGFKNLNTAMLAKAISDVQSGKKTLLTDAQANEAVMFYMSPDLRKNIDSGRMFLAKNKTRKGIKTTASGLQYEAITEGSGEHPKAIDTAVVNYTGSFVNGKIFESSVGSGKPVEFPLDHVIKGWTEGIQLMTPGSKYKFYIPYQLAYGPNANGPIPAGSTLVFEVDLLQVKKTMGGGMGN